LLSGFDYISFFKMIYALFIGLLGSLIFIYLHLPLPWLLGSILATSLAVRFEKLPLKSPKTFASPARIIIGLTIGGSFTPTVLDYIGTYFFSLLFIIPFSAITIIAGIIYYEKFLGFDKKTAYLSAMPGGLIEMIIIAEEIKANIAKITLVQSSRLFFIVVSLPFIIQYILGVDIRGNKTITTSVVNIDLLELIFLFAMGIITAIIAKKIKLSAAYLIGPMIISIVLHLTAVVTTPMPDELLKFVQVVFGTLIGFTFKGVKLSEVVKTLLGTFGHFLILVLISFIFIVIVSSLFDFDLLSILLAFSPGGQADINLIAILVGATVPYITLHHIVRLFIVINIAYFFAKKI